MALGQPPGRRRPLVIDRLYTKRDQLRRWVATITQEVDVFAGPLIDDLRLVAPEVDADEIWAALHRVGAGGWVEA